MSCESCTGCFEATPCSAPSPSLNGHISREYRQFLKSARICSSIVGDHQDPDRSADNDAALKDKKSAARKDQEDHSFNTLIGILANGQFTAQTYLAQAYKQCGPSNFLRLARSLAHHGFWGRLITWAYLFVKEDSVMLQRLIDGCDLELLQTVNDEAEMFEVFNPSVSCQRVRWNPDPLPK